MSSKYTLHNGFMIDYSWLDMLAIVPPKDFKSLLLGVCQYQQSYGQHPYPANFKKDSRADFAAKIMKPRIDYRLNGAMRKTTTVAGSAVVSPAPPPTPRSAADRAYAAAPLISNEIKIAQMTSSEGEGNGQGEDSAAPCRPASEAASSCAEVGTPTPSEVKLAYGMNRNVLLTAAQYRALTETHGIPSAYIEHFSEQLRHNGYAINNHFSTLLAWWERDRYTPRWGGAPSSVSTPPHAKSLLCSMDKDTPSRSFDPDEFYRLAVIHSLGEEALECDDIP